MDCNPPFFSSRELRMSAYNDFLLRIRAFSSDSLLLLFRREHWDACNPGSYPLLYGQYASVRHSYDTVRVYAFEILAHIRICKEEYPVLEPTFFL